MPTAAKPTATQLIEKLLADLAESDPVYAHTIEAMKMLEAALLQRKNAPPETTCQCGGTAVWDHQEKHWDCADCRRFWSA
jgi:hypothetical protein